jgi:hypothetical protein
MDLAHWLWLATAVIALPVDRNVFPAANSRVPGTVAANLRIGARPPLPRPRAHQPSFRQDQP